MRAFHSHLASALSIACIIHVIATTRPARADDTNASAEELFQQARALVDAGKYAEACPKLERSQKLDPAVGTQFNLADCWEHVGRTASAYETFGQVASIARAAGKFERERSARERIAALEPRLARVRLVVNATAPGLELRIDDLAIDKARWTGAFPIDPGPHVVRATAPGRLPFEARFTAVERSSVDTNVPELVDPMPPPPPPIVAAPTSSTQRTLAVVAGGVGIAAIGVGSIFGIVAISKKSTAERECPSGTFHFRCPTEEGSSAWNSSTSAGTISTIGFVAGAVLLAGAGVLWFTAPSSRTRVGASLSSLHLEGSF
jgi:hypothetical protein